MPIHAAFLRYFDEVCRRGSIRLAARHLYVASSAVNRQILKVEEELGTPLFERNPGGLRLTEAGRLLQQHVGRTLIDGERTLAEIAALAERARPQVTLLGQESVIAHFLPPALVTLHAEQPQVSTVFKAVSGTRLVEELAAGHGDVALAFDPQPASGVEQMASCELAVGAVVSAEHPLAGRERVSLADCAPFPIVLPDRSWPLRERLDRAIEHSALDMNIATTSNSVEFLKAMVEQRQGIGFQALIGIEPQVQRGELLHIPLGEPPLRQHFCLLVRSDCARQPVVLRVLELLAARLDDYRR